MTNYLQVIDPGHAIGGGDMLLVFGEDDTVVQLSGSDPRPDLPRDRLTFFMGDNLTGNFKTVGDTHGGKYSLASIPSGSNSVYVPPGWQVKLYEESDRKKAGTTGDQGKRWSFDGPAVFTRPNKPGYGRKYNWAWVKAFDRRTEEQRLRDQQVQTLQRETTTTAAEAALAQRLALEAEKTRAELEKAQASIAEREALRTELATRQASEAAEQAKASQLAIQEAQASAQAQWADQQRQAAEQIAAARGETGAPKWLLPAAAVGAGLLIVGAMLMARRH